MWFKVVDQPFALMVTASTIADKERSCILFWEGRWYGNLSMKSSSKKVFFTKCEAKTYAYFQCWQRMTELKRRYLIFWHFSGQKYKNIFLKFSLKFILTFSFVWVSIESHIKPFSSTEGSVPDTGTEQWRNNEIIQRMQQ